jgi:hypothetical protein
MITSAQLIEAIVIFWEELFASRFERLIDLNLSMIRYLI